MRSLKSIFGKVCLDFELSDDQTKFVESALWCWKPAKKYWLHERLPVWKLSALLLALDKKAQNRLSSLTLWQFSHNFHAIKYTGLKACTSPQDLDKLIELHENLTNLETKQRIRDHGCYVKPNCRQNHWKLENLADAKFYMNKVFGNNSSTLFFMALDNTVSNANID